MGAGLGVRAVGLHPLEHLDGDARTTWLGILAGVSGVLVGLELAAVTMFYAVTPGERLRYALGKVGYGLTRLLRSCLVGLAACTAAFALAVPFYRDGNVTGVSFGLLAVGVVMVLRTGRLMWLFFQLLRTFAAEAHDSAYPRQPPLVTEWEPPEVDPSNFKVPVRKVGSRGTRRRSE